MPPRPKEHQVADESRRAFEAALPKAWVFRSEVPDYGIDGDVEVFDDDGNSTGYRFHVQLKATNNEAAKSALAVSLRLETCAYYSALDLPVLIVSYHAHTATIFVRWYHEFDPYYGGVGEKTITFRFDQSNQWSDSTPAEILLDLRRRRQVRMGAFSRPVPVFLSVATKSVGGVSIELVKEALSGAFAALHGTATISDQHDALVVIHVAGGEIAVSVGSEIRSTLHLNAEVGDPQVLAHNVLLLLALALGKAGQSGLTAQIAEVAVTAVAKASIIKDPRVFSRIARYLAGGGRIIEALALSEKLVGQFGSEWAAEALRIPALAREHLSALEIEFYEKYLTNRVRIAEERGESLGIAVSHYNLGNYLRGARRLPEAVRQYVAAARADSGYWARDYFSREFGGVLFELHRFKCATRCYELALEAGANDSVKPLLGDAMMFSGDYSGALRVLREYLHDTSDIAAEWRLKELALTRVVEGLGIGKQARQIERARGMFGDIGQVKLDPTRILEAAMQADAVSGLAWFNRGAYCLEGGDLCEAGFSYLVAALCQRRDVTAWLNAYALTIKCERHRNLGPLVLFAAYEAHGEALLQAMADLVEGPPDVARAHVGTLRKALTSLPHRERPVELRLLDTEGGYVSYDLKSGTPTSRGPSSIPGIDSRRGDAKTAAP